ncbi:ribonuclease III domain-containing protein, partial [Mycena rosella]
LPPLPKILQEDIRMRVFTHCSYFLRPANVFEDSPDDPSLDSEKFEHLGDAILGLVVTSLVLEMYPGLHVGPSTKVRAMIAATKSLAEISIKYKLPEQLRLHPAQAGTLCASIGMQADLFESYIGGLYTDQGLAPVKVWLDALLRPYAHAAYTSVRAQHGIPPVGPSRPPSAGGSTGAQSSTSSTPAGPVGHLAVFNKHMQKRTQRVEWVYSDQHPFGDAAAAAWAGSKTTPVWSVQVVVDGAVLGRGRGRSKKEARNEAAKEALAHLDVGVWCVPFCIM